MYFGIINEYIFFNTDININNIELLDDWYYFKSFFMWMSMNYDFMA